MWLVEWVEGVRPVVHAAAEVVVWVLGAGVVVVVLREIMEYWE